ncbi:branched-chain amino acid ABC transporter permease [Actinomadura sp. DC4]|uniref:branched-chain amino acid ABC transporter permease n=1 Tax=Actinomadura sp. DC4 TaxID=3055069 RepID=UPI0025B24638|nr:branched-chain amino acid ABC transporter permease [Actinomadura sp. DC4]MDN3356348.1 branched-chain amino acid ABC transporter permease [Actinomadura sp. DC4]
MTGSRNALLRAAALVAMVACTFTVSDYELSLFAQVALTAVALLGLNLLVGYCGQLSLGHGAFYAIGAYTAAILITRTSVGYLWTLPAAAVVGFLVGLVVGIPAVRLRGFSLALVTLALAIALPQLLKRFGSVTGGQLGITVPRPAPPGGLTTDQWTYLIAVVVVFVVFLGVRNLVSSRIGSALVAVRDNEPAAGAMGIAVARTKVMTFAVSAGLTSLAGGLATLVTGYVSPDSFNMLLSVNLVAGIVLGGLGTVWGAVIGAAFLTFLPLYTTDISQTAPGIVNGLVIIAFLLLLPDGVAGFLTRHARRLRSRIGTPRSSSVPDSEPDSEPVRT